MRIFGLKGLIFDLSLISKSKKNSEENNGIYSNKLISNKKEPTSHKCVLKEMLKGILLLCTSQLFAGSNA